jgi:hypothetical protein
VAKVGRQLALVAVAGSAAGLIAVRAGVAGHKAQRGLAAPTAGQVAQLRAVAFETAAENGDSHPTGGTVVATTKKAIFALNHGMEPAEAPDVYVVTLYGNFVAKNARVPAGAPLPTGHEMVLVFDAATLTPLSFMLGDSPINADRVGTAQPLTTPN